VTVSCLFLVWCACEVRPPSIFPVIFDGLENQYCDFPFEDLSRWFNAVFTVYWYEVNLRQEVDFLVYVFVDLVFSCVWCVPLSVGVAWESIYSKVPSAESFRRHKSNLTKNESVSIIDVHYYSSRVAALARTVVCTREGLNSSRSSKIGIRPPSTHQTTTTCNPTKQLNTTINNQLGVANPSKLQSKKRQSLTTKLL
jgi:hypothetical protein